MKVSGHSIWASYEEITVEQQWDAKAACAGQPQEYWMVDKVGILSERDRENLKTGQWICNEICPIRGTCISRATDEDLHWTVRAGLWPTAYSETGKSSLHMQTKYLPNASEIEGQCSNGHDLAELGITKRGRCVACRQARAKKYYAQKKEAGTLPRRTWVPRGPRQPALPPLTPEERAAGECGQGHDIRHPEDRSSHGRCLSCMAARKRERERLRRKGE